MRHPFVDTDGHTRHCWECTHSCEWKAFRGWCDAYEFPVTRWNTPQDYLDKVACCELYEREVDG
jgi:hypothetical protein